MRATARERSARALDASDLAILALGLVLLVVTGAQAERPCDDYPVSRQSRCERLWKQINQEAEAEMAEFGWRQLRRRQEGAISAEQHVHENLAFIQASGQRRLKQLRERMEAE